MEVYRITHEKWANTLQPSGYAARWNSNGIFMLYTSSSRPLACLENLVHRSGEGLNNKFKCMIIHIPDMLEITEVILEELDEMWFGYENYKYCQDIGDKWINEGKTPLLKVPSAIIKNNHNILINPRHPGFNKIRITQVEDFKFDPRLES
jgi:RES domain-containing protein